MLRTEQTLRLIYGEAPHEIWPELREISFGIFEGKSYDELKGLAEYEAWLAGDWFGNVPPGGESFAQAQALGLPGIGKLEPGYQADIVLLTREFKVSKTLVDGEIRYEA